MDTQHANNLVLKFAKENYISHIIKLLKLTQPNKVLPVDNEFYEMEKKINASTGEFIDSDECSTVGLSSNPSSFTSNESAEEYFSDKTYSFNPSRFKMISILGSGSFGIVLLAQYETEYYAVKKLPKHRITKGEMDQIMAEKDLLMQINSSFILRLFGTCQTKNELYFVTEVLENGDLFQAIYNEERLTHEEIVFYAAGIVLAINFMHNKDIVYRDLKPENIMIGSNGYPKIIDFGLAKKVPYTKIDSEGITRNYTKCYTLCGTPEYVAPEIILGSGYDKAVDLWSLGVLIYEMIYRTTPFIDKEKNEDRITKVLTNIVMCGKNGIDITTKIDKKTDGTPNARNLITQLLTGDKTVRLGGGNEPSALLDHPYFLSTFINYDNLKTQSYPAPLLQPEFVGRHIETEKKIEEYTGDQDMFKDF
jgi:serine/threonine protein kinase